VINPGKELFGRKKVRCVTTQNLSLSEKALSHRIPASAMKSRNINDNTTDRYIQLDSSPYLEKSAMKLLSLNAGNILTSSTYFSTMTESSFFVKQTKRLCG
jgi:hypothetical protein